DTAGDEPTVYCLISSLCRDGLQLSHERSRTPSDHALHWRHYLSGIEDIERIQRLLKRAHGLNRFRPEFGAQVLLFALTDTVLAGAGPSHALRTLDQTMHEILAAGHLVRVVEVAKQRAMKIAVADMADD